MQTYANKSVPEQRLVALHKLLYEAKGTKIVISFTSLFQNHLAKRRDYTRQNKMPQLPELGEKETVPLDNNNEAPKPDNDLKIKVGCVNFLLVL